MADDIEKIIRRAEESRQILRALTGRPTVGLRDVVRLSVQNAAQKMAKSVSTNMKAEEDHVPQRRQKLRQTSDQSKQIRPLKMVKERFMQQQQPRQQQPPQKTREELKQMEIQRKLEEKKRREKEEEKAKLARMSSMSVNIGSDKSG